MISLTIPGRGPLALAHLVLDFNGTLACDGQLLAGAGELLQQLGAQLAIHVVTADTFGSVRAQLAGIPCTVAVLEEGQQDVQKLRYVEALGAGQVAAVGNGANDRLMLEAAALGIALIQAEGAWAKTLLSADVVCLTIADALDLLLHPRRLVATLRI